MKLIERICFPTDFAEGSEVVLKSVIEIAKRFGSEVNLIHALPSEIHRESIEPIIKEKMLGFQKQLKDSGIICSTDLLVGKHVNEVISFFNKKKANLIVLGSGKVGKAKFKLGSNSEKIIRNSSVPVWIVENESTAIPNSILCPVDFSEESISALNDAIQLCRSFECKLEILHAVKGFDKEYAELGADISKEQSQMLSEHEYELNDLVKKVDLSGIEWEKEIIQGDPAEVILNTIEEKNIDLLVMGSTGKGAIKRILVGSVTERVSREVPCSFVISKSEGLIHLILDEDLTDIESIYQEGVELAKQGYIEEAIESWRRCIYLNELFLKAWTAIEKAYENLGDSENAARYRESRDQIQRRIWDKQVEADLRGKHFLFK